MVAWTNVDRPDPSQQGLKHRLGLRVAEFLLEVDRPDPPQQGLKRVGRASGRGSGSGRPPRSITTRLEAKSNLCNPTDLPLAGWPDPVGIIP